MGFTPNPSTHEREFPGGLVAFLAVRNCARWFKLRFEVIGKVRQISLRRNRRLLEAGDVGTRYETREGDPKCGRGPRRVRQIS